MQHKKEYFWAIAGKFLPQFIYLITTMILARYLTPDDFGTIGVLAIFFTVANTLIDSGLGGSLIKEKEISDLDCSTISVFNLTLSHFIYLCIFFLSDTIEHFYNVENLGSIVKILSIIFIINAWGLVPQNLLIRELRFRTRMIISVISVIASAITAIIMAIMELGVWSLVAYQLVGAAITVVLSITATHYQPSFKFSFKSIKRLLPFGVFTTLSATIDTIYENLTISLFGKYLSIQQAGLLYQAKRIEEVPTQSLLVTISSVSFPVLTKLRMDPNKFSEECKSIFKMVLLIMLPLLACLSLFSTPIIELLFGNKWIDAAPYLTLLVIAGVFHIAENLNRTFIKSTTKVDKLFVYTIIKRSIGICIIICCVIWNTNLLLIGYVVSTFVGFVVNCILLSKVSEFNFYNQLSLFIKVLFPTLVFYFVIFFIMKLLTPLCYHVIFAVVLLILYYFIFLRRYGINIVSIICNLNKK